MTHTPITEEKNDCFSSIGLEQKHSKQHSEYKGGKYYCPMNCEGDKVYELPGNCPECGMELVQALNYPNSK